jgi:hypothetical protein
LSVVEYQAASGAWQAPYVLGPLAPNGAFGAVIAADQSGDVYVVYNNSQSASAPFPLMWAEYTPASGWQPPAVAYNSPYNFGEVMAAVDSAGHLVVVFNANGVSSIVYDTATSSWGSVQELVTLSFNPGAPTMAANASGSRLALVYWENVVGMKYSFFNSSSAEWEKPAVIPDSEDATTGYAEGTYFPLAVDSSGNVTLVTAWQPHLHKYSVAGFRYEGGAWQMTQLVPLGSQLNDISDFASVAQSPSGSVLVAVPYSTGTEFSITAFRYTPGVGWDTETVATLAGSGAARCAVAWFQSGEAVVAYYDSGPVGGSTIEGAALYSNGAWSSGPPIPDAYLTYYPGMATAPNGDVLLIMSSAVLEETYTYGVVATWLQP